MEFPEGITIIPLNKEYLKKAIKLVESVFTDEEDSVRREIEASVYEKKFQQYITKVDRHTKSLEYFIAVDAKGRLIGIIGMYTLIENYKDTLWIGWYCVDKKHRRRGIGRLLLDFVITKAQERNKRYICLYTSTDRNEAEAQDIYDKYGFYVTEAVHKDGYDILFRKKTL